MNWLENNNTKNQCISIYVLTFFKMAEFNGKHVSFIDRKTPNYNMYHQTILAVIQPRINFL